ncbi:hypothetical protein EB796_010569 [Bugula neritina]|uniref:Uncharacterized protein n=1 Tax=Bugula neritina TaxID=10212 RepID=A0A7J7JYS8_BUGNE|nr:hypothetical protein EB796_010569 [Bugula neritina]
MCVSISISSRWKISNLESSCGLVRKISTIDQFDTNKFFLCVLKVYIGRQGWTTQRSRKSATLVSAHD